MASHDTNGSSSNVNVTESSSSSGTGTQSNSNPTQSSSSSGTGTQTDNLPSTLTPVESDYQEVILEAAQQSQVWGSVNPVNDRKYHSLNLRGEEKITFGRFPNCSYVFDKLRDNLSDTEYLNISKIQFIIKKTGNSVNLKNKSSNGTFIDGNYVKKEVEYPLAHLSIISMGLAGNKVFQYVDRNAKEFEERTMPLAFKEKYSLLHNKILGKGATGEVKVCFPVANPTKYFAVKILRKGRSFQVVKDFGYEANILGTVEHQNIVKVIDSYENEHNVHMVMELVEGGELFDHIKNNGPVVEEKAKHYFQQLVDGVSYLHSKGITHRDLKPENILLNNKKNPTVLKITDFGLSRFVSETSLMETLVGTPSYLAPEILEPRKGYTKKVDAWSLGCILFILLGGYPPFSSENAEEDLYTSIKSGNYTFHEERWEHISSDAKDLVTKLLTVNPTERLDVKECGNHPWLKSDSMEPAQKKIKI